MHHHFDTSIAETYGVNVAIFLSNMAYWIQKNIANEKHFYEGRYWTYNSVSAYSVIFPYWSAKQIRTIIDHCISHGLIIKDRFNKTKYDQTQWYALTDLGHKLLNIPILPNGQMDSTKKANVFDQKGKPIPDTKPDTKNKERERARKKRVPLPPDFLPNERMLILLDETAKRVGISATQLTVKFKNVMQSYAKESADWQAELENFLLGERSPSDHGKGSKVNKIVQPSANLKEWGPGHPTWEANQEFERSKKKKSNTPFNQRDSYVIQKTATHTDMGGINAVEREGREFARDHLRDHFGGKVKGDLF